MQMAIVFVESRLTRRPQSVYADLCVEEPEASASLVAEPENHFECVRMLTGIENRWVLIALLPAHRLSSDRRPKRVEMRVNVQLNEVIAFAVLADLESSPRSRCDHGRALNGGGHRLEELQSRDYHQCCPLRNLRLSGLGSKLELATEYVRLPDRTLRGRRSERANRCAA